MRLPPLNNPEKYVGLYVFDFGDHVSVGYTGAEITMLLQSEQFGTGRAYRIHRVQPDGRIELVGVSARTFSQQDGLFFLRSGLDAARTDYDALAALADRELPPCHLRMELAEIERGAAPAVTALLFPAESTHDVGRWLSQTAFQGGDQVLGGPQAVCEYREGALRIVEQQQLEAAGPTGRQWGEVLASVQLPLQR